jgi:hypothetical protein
MADAVNVKAFGAIGDGSTDDTDAIQDAIDYAKTLDFPTIVFPHGEYKTTDTLEFDVPNGTTILFSGKIWSTVSAKPAVRLGSTGIVNSTVKLNVTGLKVERTTTDMDVGGTTSNSIGIALTNIAQSCIDIRECAGFTDGVICYGTAVNGGFSYNEVHLGRLHDNKRNFRINASGVGYCNENSFFGGSFNHSSNYPNYTGTVNLQLDHNTDSTNWLNNNRFFGPSMEANSTLSTAAIINGDSNLIFHPRLEQGAGTTVEEKAINQAAYLIQFTTNARYCGVMGLGFGVSLSNIDDSGLGNYYEGRDGMVRKSVAGTGAAESVFALQSTVSAAAKLVSLRDTGGTEAGYIDGQGRIWMGDRGYFANGVRFLSTDGSYNDVGVFVGSASPEGAVTAEPGSVYIRKAGGAGTSVYAKISGSSNTGWSPVPTQAAAVPDGSAMNTLLAALRASGVIAT